MCVLPFSASPLDRLADVGLQPFTAQLLGVFSAVGVATVDDLCMLTEKASDCNDITMDVSVSSSFGQISILLSYQDLEGCHVPIVPRRKLLKAVQERGPIAVYGTFHVC